MNKTKVCTKCKVEYPATSEYWHRDKRGRDGFNSYCKKCRSEYTRQHRKENKEHLKEYNRQYYQENKEKAKQYYQENKECIKEYNKQYRKENREQIKEREKQYRKENKERYKEHNKKRYQENKELHKMWVKQWRQNNRNKSREIDQRYKARKRKLPYTLTVQEWKETKQIFDNSCAYCGMTREEHRQEHNQILHQDHFIPLSKGGGYTKENIIPACISCNSSKNDTDFEEWYPQYEYYSKEREQKILDYMGGLNE